MNKKEYYIYDVGDDFIMEIGLNNGINEAWIYHKDFGIKMFIEGRSNVSCDDLFKLIKNKLEDEKDTYKLEYMS